MRSIKKKKKENKYKHHKQFKGMMRRDTVKGLKEQWNDKGD
jgi:hypothetical protein